MIYRHLVLITIELRILLARVHGFIDDLKGDTMNSLKTKLVAAVTMLAVATVMLTSASFAWYTVSTTGDIKAVELEMEATDNLEIATYNGGTAPEEVDLGQTGDETKWGNFISGVTLGSVNYPAILDGTTWKTAAADAGGRISELEGISPEAGAKDGEGRLTYTADVTNIGNVKVIGCGTCWLRANGETGESVDVTVNIDTSACALTGGKSTKSAGFQSSEAFLAVKLADGNWVADGDTITLTANTPTQVEVGMAVGGDHITAQDIDSEDGLKVTGAKVKFTRGSAE